jgi:hypothetical protein
MSKALDRRLKLLEMKDGRIIVSEPFFTAEEEKAFEMLAMSIIEKNALDYANQTGQYAFLRNKPAEVKK